MKMATESDLNTDAIHRVTMRPGICSGKRSEMKCVACSVAIGFLLCASLIAQSETNPVMGRLGYRVGTPLTIEGVIPARPVKGYFLVVDMVNERRLSKPIWIEVAMSRDLFLASSNTVLRLRGREKTYTVVAIRDPETGVLLQLQAPGTFLRFEIQEVIRPAGFTVDKGEWKKKSEQDTGANR